MPSSRWIRVNDVNNHGRMSDGPEVGRDGHTRRESQLIILEDIYARPAATNTGIDRKVSVCDTACSPVRLLNTWTYGWEDTHSPEVDAYHVPPVARSIYCNEAHGD